MENEKKERRFGWRTLVFCLFALIFLVSGGITASTLIAHHKADKAIQELRVQARESLSGYGMVIRAEDNAAQQPEKTEAADPAVKEKAPERQISMDFTELLKVNPDIKGWIFGEGTNVDYPVLHTDSISSTARNAVRSTAVAVRLRPGQWWFGFLRAAGLLFLQIAFDLFIYFRKIHRAFSV